SIPGAPTSFQNLQPSPLDQTLPLIRIASSYQFIGGCIFYSTLASSQRIFLPRFLHISKERGVVIQPCLMQGNSRQFFVTGKQLAGGARQRVLYIQNASADLARS